MHASLHDSPNIEYAVFVRHEKDWHVDKSRDAGFLTPLKPYSSHYLSIVFFFFFLIFHLRGNTGQAFKGLE